MVAAGFDEIRVRYGTHLVAAFIAALGERGTQALPMLSLGCARPPPRLTPGPALGVPSRLAECRENIC